MIQRCTNPKNTSWANYGGRGIKVCRRWRDSFDDFLADVGEKPEGDYSIDRKDNDGDYEPGNVQWTIRTKQNRNRRNTQLISFRGKRKTLVEWEEESGIKWVTIRARLRRGWSIRDALTVLVRSQGV